MSAKTGKVCGNCRHNIRTNKINGVRCHCALTGNYIGDVDCTTGWCRHWGKEWIRNERKRRNRRIKND